VISLSLGYCISNVDCLLLAHECCVESAVTQWQLCPSVRHCYVLLCYCWRCLKTKYITIWNEEWWIMEGMLRMRRVLRLRSFRRIERNWYCDFMECVWLDCDSVLTMLYWSDFKAQIRCRKHDPAVNYMLQFTSRRPYDGGMPTRPHPCPQF